MSDVIRLATRRSHLALTQARAVASALTERSGMRVQLVEVVSEGDTTSAPLVEIGGAGVFVAAVRTAVLDGRADIAVHSAKDLPTAPAPGLSLGAVPVREDPRDVVCSRDGLRLGELPAGSRIGTGSPRRAAQLAMLRPDLEVVGIRGNVDTRLSRLDDDLDAVVLAAAGLSRLGRLSTVSEFLEPETMLPAPGQGALAVEIADGAPAAVASAVRDLDDPATRACVTAERSMLAELAAGCSAPVGSLGVVSEPGYWEPEIFLRGGVFGATEAIRMSITGTAAAAEELGRDLAVRMLAAGAAALMTERQ